MSKIKTRENNIENLCLNEIAFQTLTKSNMEANQANTEKIASMLLKPRQVVFQADDNIRTFQEAGSCKHIQSGNEKEIISAH